MIDDHLSMARREAIALLAEKGIADDWRPLDGGRGADIIAVIDGIIQLVEGGDMPELEALADWPETFGDEPARIMLEALDNAQALHLATADRLAKVLAVLRWREPEEPPAMPPETAQALEARLGKAKAYADEKAAQRAALATTRAMKAVGIFRASAYNPTPIIKKRGRKK